MKAPFAADITAPAPVAQESNDSAWKFDPFAAQRAIRDSRTLTSPQRLVALILIGHAGRSGVCWPSVATLCEETDLSRSAVLAALQGLREADVLAWERRDKRGTSSLYTIRVKSYPVHEVDPPGPLDGPTPVQVMDPPRPSGGHKQPMEQPTGTTKLKGEGNPPPAPRPPEQSQEMRDWSVIDAESRRLRLERHWTEGVREHMSVDTRSAIVEFFADAADEVQGDWNELYPGSTTREHAHISVVRVLLRKWFFEYEGHDDYLVRRKHPLRALRDDLTAVHSDWLEEWEKKLNEERAKLGIAVAS